MYIKNHTCLRASWPKTSSALKSRTTLADNVAMQLAATLSIQNGGATLQLTPAAAPNIYIEVPSIPSIRQGIASGDPPSHTSKRDLTDREIQMQICNIQRSLQLNTGAGGQWTTAADDKMRKWLLAPKRVRQGHGPLVALPPAPLELLALPPAPAAADDGSDTDSSSTAEEEDEEGDEEEEGDNHSDKLQEDDRASSLHGDAAQGITDEQVMDHPLYVQLLDEYSEMEKEAADLKRKVEELAEADVGRVFQCQKYEEEIEELRKENKRLKAKAS